MNKWDKIKETDHEKWLLSGPHIEDRIEPLICNGDLQVFDINCQEAWCTFPNELLQKLPDEKKKEMFQKIQAVIDEYKKDLE